MTSSIPSLDSTNLSTTTPNKNNTSPSVPITKTQYDIPNLTNLIKYTYTTMYLLLSSEDNLHHYPQELEEIEKNQSNKCVIENLPYGDNMNAKV